MNPKMKGHMTDVLPQEKLLECSETVLLLPKPSNVCLTTNYDQINETVLPANETSDGKLLVKANSFYYLEMKLEAFILPNVHRLKLVDFSKSF